MTHDIHEVPGDLPRPIDDGACAHLPGMRLPDLELPSTSGGVVNLSRISGALVVFAYPRTGRPGQEPLVPDWNAIPGARGCTPQTCGFRDRHADLTALGVSVFGLSTQEPEYQAELVDRLHLPFPVLSDFELRFSSALRLPVFTVAGHVLLKRLAVYAEHGEIRRVFYPVFPPDENAADVLAWLTTRPPPSDPEVRR